MDGAIAGVESLNLKDEGVGVKGQKLRNERKNPLPPVSLKTGGRSSRGRNRRSGLKWVDPKQKLISDMMPEKSTVGKEEKKKQKQKD